MFYPQSPAMLPPQRDGVFPVICTLHYFFRSDREGGGGPHTYGGSRVLHLDELVAHEGPRRQVVPVHSQRSSKVQYRLRHVARAAPPTFNLRATPQTSLCGG